MSIQEYIEKGGTLVFDPAETNLAPDVLLANYGNYIDSICIVAKSEAGSTYFQSSTAPKDPRFGDLFASFAQIANDIGIQVYALLHGNMDGFFSRDPNFQMQRSGGISINGYVCPSQEIYWQYLAEIAAEVTQKVDLEGIILTDVHYPRNVACFCENCRRTFSMKNNIDRDFSLEQINKNSSLKGKWQDYRIASLRGLISTVVSRVHQEKKIEVITEMLLDPMTNYFSGAVEHFAQDINVITQITPHLLLHFHPWTPFPTTTEEMELFNQETQAVKTRLASSKNSLFLWEAQPNNFEFALQLKNTFSSQQLFFTDHKPASYSDRRTTHLNLGI